MDRNDHPGSFSSQNSDTPEPPSIHVVAGARVLGLLPRGQSTLRLFPVTRGPQSPALGKEGKEGAVEEEGEEEDNLQKAHHRSLGSGLKVQILLCRRLAVALGQVT